MVTKTITRKKTSKTVEQELLSSLMENNAVEEPGLDINNVTDPREAINIVNQYGQIMRTQNKKTIGCFAKSDSY